MKAKDANKKKKSIIQQMVEDKRTVRQYFKEHGTLKGFKSDTIILGKPF